MKNIFRSAGHCQENHFAFTSRVKYHRYDVLLVIGSIIVLIGFLFTGCKKESMDLTADQNQIQNKNSHAEHGDGNTVNNYTGLTFQTLWELLQARAATARYRNIQNAIRDGYSDISVIVPNMGHHYMKSSLVDANFEVRKPEILVYNKNHHGDFELVAVEYAVPINLSPDRAPSGFTGTADVWDRNTGFGLWLLHAWVWHYNPAGVFNPTNPLIHVH
jgi:hypothetical protein